MQTADDPARAALRPACEELADAALALKARMQSAGGIDKSRAGAPQGAASPAGDARAMIANRPLRDLAPPATVPSQGTRRLVALHPLVLSSGVLRADQTTGVISHVRAHVGLARYAHSKTSGYAALESACLPLKTGADAPMKIAVDENSRASRCPSGFPTAPRLG